MATRRIGLFGGSFDPVHDGHLHVARAAQRAFELDRIVFVPAAAPPHKPGVVLAPGADRRAMLRLALEDEPTWCEIGLELERGGTSFTIDTVRALPAAIGEAEDVRIHLLIGSDNLAGLPHWREARELVTRVQPIVIERADDAPIDFEAVRAALGDELARKIERGLLRLPPVRVSSTGLRAAFARGERAPAGVSRAVLEYIHAQRLYGFSGPDVPGDPNVPGGPA